MRKEECEENARQCEWYAARTTNESEHRFLLRKAKYWSARAAENASEIRAPKAA
jgi:hypothetical protein